jgi:hypothetical protein
MENIIQFARNLVFGYPKSKQENKKSIISAIEQILANKDAQILGNTAKEVVKGYVPGGQEVSNLYSQDTTPQQKALAMAKLANPMGLMGEYGLNIGKAMLASPFVAGETIGRSAGEMLGNKIYGDQYEPNRNSIFGGQSLQAQNETLKQQGASDVLSAGLPAAQLAMQLLMAKKSPKVVKGAASMAQDFVKKNPDFALKQIKEQTVSGGVDITKTKLINKSGQPITYYRGVKDINKPLNVSQSEYDMWGNGIYLTPNKKIAQSYAQNGGKVIEAQINAQKILRPGMKDWTTFINKGEPSAKLDFLKRRGYDAVMSSKGEYSQVMVVSPEKIKLLSH